MISATRTIRQKTGPKLEKNAVTRSDSAQSQQYQGPGRKNLAWLKRGLSVAILGLSVADWPNFPPPYTGPVSLTYAHMLRRFRADRHPKDKACNPGRLRQRPAPCRSTIVSGELSFTSTIPNDSSNQDDACPPAGYERGIQARAQALTPRLVRSSSGPRPAAHPVGPGGWALTQGRSSGALGLGICAGRQGAGA